MMIMIVIVVVVVLVAVVVAVVVTVAVSFTTRPSQHFLLSKGKILSDDCVQVSIIFRQWTLSALFWHTVKRAM